MKFAQAEALESVERFAVERHVHRNVRADVASPGSDLVERGKQFVGVAVLCNEGIGTRLDGAAGDPRIAVHGQHDNPGRAVMQAEPLQKVQSAQGFGFERKVEDDHVRAATPIDRCGLDGCIGEKDRFDACDLQ